VHDTALPGEFFLEIMPSVPNPNKKSFQGEKLPINLVLDARLEVDDENIGQPLLALLVLKKKGGISLDRNQVVETSILYETEYVSEIVQCYRQTRQLAESTRQKRVENLHTRALY
jgi:hypothetical protein